MGLLLLLPLFRLSPATYHTSLMLVLLFFWLYVYLAAAAHKNIAIMCGPGSELRSRERGQKPKSNNGVRVWLLWYSSSCGRLFMMLLGGGVPV